MSHRAIIRGVTFDVGGTLIQPWPSVGHVYSQIAEQHGHRNVSPAELNRRFASAWKAKGLFSHARGEWQKLVNETFRGLIPGGPSDQLFDDLYWHFGTRAAWRVFDDAFPALDELHTRGYRLGIISNWDERLRPLLSDLGLARYFAACSISIEVGRPKPDRLIFERAAEAIGLEPGSLLHVGDTPTEDVEGARASGFAAVLLDREGRRSGPGVVCGLERLPELLEKQLLTAN